MAARQSLKYGVAAVAIAAVIVAAALVVSPTGTGVTTTTTTSSTATQTTLQSTSQSAQTTSQSAQTTSSSQPANFFVLLTDPPSVPAGTTQLNLTYSGVSLLVSYPNGTKSWLPINASGTVNLLSLVNVTQTIASVSVPTGSTVDKIQFTVSSVQTEVNGVVYPVTSLSNQLVVSIANAGVAVNQTLSAGVLDLRPSLVPITATNSTGGTVNYYVLVPSATAIIQNNVSQGQSKVGSRERLNTKDREGLDSAQQHGMANVTIASTTLSVTGNLTDFSITLTNQGTSNATVFGLTLHGAFNASLSQPSSCQQRTSTTTSTTSTTSGNETTSSTNTTTSGNETTSNTNTTSSHSSEGSDRGNPVNGTTYQHTRSESCNPSRVQEHPDTIPFKINGTSLVALFGDGGREGAGSASSITIQPGASVTLSFSGVLQLSTDGGNNHHSDSNGGSASIVIVPVSGSTYTVRLTGEGFQTSQVKAT